MSKVKEFFSNEAINKSTETTTLLNMLDLPPEVRNWLLIKFSSEDGIDAFELSKYVKAMRLKPNEWNIKLLEATHSKKGVITLLTKVNIEFNNAKNIICFSLPEYNFPKKQTEAQVDWSVIAENKEFLLKSDGAWGELTLQYDCGIVELIGFVPLCPYKSNLSEYCSKRSNFTTEEWIDVLISGLNFNPTSFKKEEKLIFLQRFLPFVEKRLNMIELAIKGSAKTYCYSQLSSHNWMTSGTVSRATAFFNNTTKTVGYFGHNDNVIWDEVQTLKCTNVEEMNGVLKPYLESGEIRIGSYYGTADAGLTLVGNISVDNMSLDKNMLSELPKMFKESAFIDRFALIIEGWKIGRFTEERKYNGCGIVTDYLTEMFHELREEFYYRAIVDELLYVEGSCDARNFEAVKKVCTAYVKLLFPHVKYASDIDLAEFEEYCLKPAIRGREGILKQLRFLDKEYNNVKMPNIKIKH